MLQLQAAQCSNTVCGKSSQVVRGASVQNRFALLRKQQLLDAPQVLFDDPQARGQTRATMARIGVQESKAQRTKLGYAQKKKNAWAKEHDAPKAMRLLPQRRNRQVVPMARGNPGQKVSLASYHSV